MFNHFKPLLLYFFMVMSCGSPLQNFPNWTNNSVIKVNNSIFSGYTNRSKIHKPSRNFFFAYSQRYTSFLNKMAAIVPQNIIVCPKKDISKFIHHYGSTNGNFYNLFLKLSLYHSCATIVFVPNNSAVNI